MTHLKCGTALLQFLLIRILLNYKDALRMRSAILLLSKGDYYCQSHKNLLLRCSDRTTVVECVEQTSKPDQIFL